jgi:hypothetical protein
MFNEVAAVSAKGGAFQGQRANMNRYSLFPNGDPIDGMIDLSLVGTEIESPR